MTTKKQLIQTWFNKQGGQANFQTTQKGLDKVQI